MYRDSSESKSQGTLLQVIKREPKAWVSYLKEFIELALKVKRVCWRCFLIAGIPIMANPRIVGLFRIQLIVH